MPASDKDREEIDRQQAEIFEMELARQLCDCGLVNPQVPYTAHGATCAYRKDKEAEILKG